MDFNDKNICDIVQDLLPLYVDGVCSEAGRKLVEEHIPACSRCQETKKYLDDPSIEASVKTEKDSVLARHARKERSTAWKAGAIIAGILLIPIIIVAIVTAAGKSGGLG